MFYRILMTAFLLFASGTAYAGVNDNESRKTNCDTAGGAVEDITDSTFACLLKGSSETVAAVVCSEGKRCTCTGNACGEFGGPDAIEIGAEDTDSLIDGLRQDFDLRNRELELMANAPETSLDGLNATRTQQNIRITISIERGTGNFSPILDSTFNNDGALVEARTRSSIMARLLDNGGGLGANDDLIACGDQCYHHLRDGRPDQYAVCYYACLIWGPDNLAPISTGTFVRQ